MQKDDQKQPMGIMKKIKKTEEKKSPKNEDKSSQEIKELASQDQQLQIELIQNLQQDDQFNEKQEHLQEYEQGVGDQIQLLKFQNELMNINGDQQYFIDVNFKKCYHRGFDQMKINEKYLTDQQKSLFEKQRKMFNYLTSNVAFSQSEINQILTYLKWGIIDEEKIKKIYQAGEVRNKSYLYCYLTSNKLKVKPYERPTDQSQKFKFWQNNSELYYKSYCAGMSFNVCLLHNDKNQNEKYCNNVTFFCTNDTGKKFVTWARNEGNLKIPDFGNPQCKIIIFLWIVLCIKLYSSKENHNLTVYPTLDNIYDFLIQMKEQKQFIPSLFSGLDFDFLKETTDE